MKEALITFSCDGPGCDTTVIVDGVLDFAPEEWYSISPPDSVTYDNDEHVDLCSLTCLTTWVAEHARMTL